MSERGGGTGWRIGGVAATFAAVIGAACSAPPVPQKPEQAASAPAASSATPMASAPVASSAPAPTAASVNERTIVIHEADLFGEIQARAGVTVHVLSLVATRAPPGAGVKGVLFRGLEGGADTEWLAIADVTVKKDADAAGTLQLTITDEKKDALVGGKKVNHFVKGVRVKLRWEY